MKFKLIKLPGIRNLLILAILIRFLVMPFYFHPDLKTTYFKVSHLQSGVVDIYTFLEQNKDKFTIKENFNYFPLTYFLLGSYNFLISPLLGNNFNEWLSDGSQQATERIGVFRYLFLLKLPYLFFDIATAFLLLNFFTEIEKKKRVFILWLFNPFSIVLIYVFSNVDIIPVFFMVLSLYFAKKEKLITSSLMLGIGAGFKIFPILLLPFLIILGKNIKEKILITIVGIGSFLLIILPFVRSSAFHQAALVSGLTTRIFSAGLNISFGEMLMPAIVALGILIFLFLTKKKIGLYKYWTITFLLILSLIHFHVQWLLWAAPFLTILFVEKSKLIAPGLILILVAFLIPFLYQDQFMSVGLFSVINPLFSSLPIPFSLVQKFYDPTTIQSILHSLLLGGSIIFSWRILED